MKIKTLRSVITLSLLALVFGLTAITACNKKDSGNNTTPTGNNVSIKNFAFDVASITVANGSTVTWTNNDATAHTVTADDGSFDSGNINPGASFSKTFSTAGTIAYHCSIHTSMHGTVIVGN